MGIYWYSICAILISMLFFLLVRLKNGTALMGLQKICWGDRKEEYGAFLIQE